MKKNVFKLLMLTVWLAYMFFMLWLFFKPFSTEQSVMLFGFWQKYLSWLSIPPDKLVHFCLFVPVPIISLLPCKVFNIRLKYLCIVGFGVFFSGFTEIVQCYIPYRSGDIIDFAADMTGFALGLIFAVLISTIAGILANGRRNHQDNGVPKKF